MKNTTHSKTTLLLSSCFFIFLGSAAHAGDEECTSFWGAIHQANDHFEEQHDKKAGKKLLDLLPSEKKQAPSGCDKQSDTVNALNRDKGYRIKLMKAGDPLAFQISFRMMHIADGAFSEELDADLANTIPRHPEKFLKYLNTEKGDVYCPKELVRALGTVDLSEKKADAILQKRTKAFQRVKNKDLNDLRLDCIKQLQLKTST